MRPLAAREVGALFATLALFRAEHVWACDVLVAGFADPAERARVVAEIRSTGDQAVLLDDATDALDRPPARVCGAIRKSQDGNLEVWTFDERRRPFLLERADGSIPIDVSTVRAVEVLRAARNGGDTVPATAPDSRLPVADDENATATPFRPGLELETQLGVSAAILRDVTCPDPAATWCDEFERQFAPRYAAATRLMAGYRASSALLLAAYGGFGFRSDAYVERSAGVQVRIYANRAPGGPALFAGAGVGYNVLGTDMLVDEGRVGKGIEVPVEVGALAPLSQHVAFGPVVRARYTRHYSSSAPPSQTAGWLDVGLAATFDTGPNGPTPTDRGPATPGRRLELAAFQALGISREPGAHPFTTAAKGRTEPQAGLEAGLRATPSWLLGVRASGYAIDAASVGYLLEPVVKWHPAPKSPTDPWLGLSAGFEASTRNHLPSGAYASLLGATAALSAGLDIRITKIFSLGPFLEARASWLTGTVSVPLFIDQSAGHGDLRESLSTFRVLGGLRSAVAVPLSPDP